MATALARNTLKKAACINTLLGKQLKCVQCVSPIQVATLRATYGEPFGYKEPYPYRKKKLNMITEWFDNTHKRLNENSKIILVDGNVAVGKNDFGRRLAKAFDLRFYPSVSPERVYVQTENLFDLRELNDIVPPSCRFYDLNDFYSEKNPACGKIAKMQVFWHFKRFENYCTACLHMLSTGQGVVIASSPFKDIVYLEAMKKMGYITPNFFRWMKTFHQETVIELMPPHLQIYLNAPLEVIRDRINKRNDPKEVNSKILNDDYLRIMDDLYKTTYLSNMRKTGEVVEVDWSEVGDDLDMDTIAEELESLKLETDDNEDTRFRAWKEYTEDDLARHRRAYCRGMSIRQMYLTRELPYDCPEIMADADDAPHWQLFYFGHPAVNRNPGFAKYTKTIDDMEP